MKTCICIPYNSNNNNKIQIVLIFGDKKIWKIFFYIHKNANGNQLRIKHFMFYCTSKKKIVILLSTIKPDLHEP